MLSLAGVWVGGFLALGPVYGVVGTIVGMLSTFGDIPEGGDVAAAASEITGGVTFALRSTQIGIAMFLVGLPVLVPSILTLKKIKKAEKEANQALQTTPMARSEI